MRGGCWAHALGSRAWSLGAARRRREEAEEAEAEAEEAGAALTGEEESKGHCDAGEASREGGGLILEAVALIDSDGVE